MKTVKSFIATDRKDFNRGVLNEQDIDKNPFILFEQWMKNAIEQEVREPYAMHLATSSNGIPNVRVLYLRGLKEDGFVFYTNYNGRKGEEIEQNEHVALNFFWAELERQVRMIGTVSKLPEKESDAYFASRPRESQLGAWASHQSKPLASHDELEQRIQALDKKYANQEVPRPPHWGGYLVKPTYFEFWQGRASRLHDRIAYTKNTNSWSIERLNP